jgi:hypothetical protein
MVDGLPKHVTDYLNRRNLKPQQIPKDVLATLATLSQEELAALDRLGASLHAAKDPTLYPLLIH